MSGKIKMRCARCGKSFRSASQKQTLCLDCEAKARQERAATRAQGAKPAAQTQPALVAPPKIVGPGAGILVPGMKPTQTSVPPETGPLGAAALAAERTQRPAPTRAGAHHEQQSKHETHGHDTRHGHEVHERSGHGEHAHTTTTGSNRAKAAREAKPTRPAAPAVTLTDELRAQIEARYLELANPVEFDGIRTQIATELGIPKTLIKRAVLDLRTRMQMPSWWELRAFTGSAEELDRIRQAYLPHLPIPAVGIHRQIASDLGLDPVTVYQGIRHIRAEMRLPQYNPPDAHMPDAPPSATGSGATAEATDATTR